MVDETEWPRTEYILSQTAYIARKPGGVSEVLQAGTKIVFQGRPGPHMEATDDAGRAAKARAGEQFTDPLRRLHLQASRPDATDLLEAIANRLVGTPTTPLPVLTPQAAPAAPQPPPAPAVPPPPPPSAPKR